ncbi:MAG: hypothetical protein ACTSWY_05615, partial [Promethearchaeota archaeon]
MDVNLKIEIKHQTLKFIKNFGPINFQQVLFYIKKHFGITTKDIFLCLNELVVEQKIRKIDNELSISRGIFISNKDWDKIFIDFCKKYEDLYEHDYYEKLMETTPEPIILASINKIKSDTAPISEISAEFNQLKIIHVIGYSCAGKTKFIHEYLHEYLHEDNFFDMKNFCADNNIDPAEFCTNPDIYNQYTIKLFKTLNNLFKSASNLNNNLLIIESSGINKNLNNYLYNDNNVLVSNICTILIKPQKFKVFHKILQDNHEKRPYLESLNSKIKDNYEKFKKLPLSNTFKWSTGRFVNSFRFNLDEFFSRIIPVEIKFRKSSNDFKNRLFSLVPDRKQNPDSPYRLSNDLLNKFQKITNK